MNDKQAVANRDSTGVERTDREPTLVMLPPADVLRGRRGDHLAA